LGGGDLAGFIEGQLSEQFLLFASVNDALSRASSCVPPGLSDPRRDLQLIPFQPAGLGQNRAVFAMDEGLFVDPQMAARRQSKCGPPQPVCITIRGRLGEPPCESVQIRHPIAAGGPPLIDAGDGAEQGGDGGPGASAQHVCLRLAPGLADKPAAEAGPSRLPKPARLGQPGVPFVLENVHRVAARRGFQQAFDAVTLDLPKTFRYFMGGEDEFTDEPLEGTR